MIDDYLRTSLIFYDTKDKQDWRKPVLHNIRIPKAQIVERYRLPPFIIRSTTLIGVPTVFKLYCKYTDVETADLLSGTYGGADLLSLEFDGTYYWLIYDGETKLKTAMPCGEQYVKISDGIRTWESEIINICGVPDNVINWLDKNTIGMIYDTQQRGENRNVLYIIGVGGPGLWYYNKKTYGGWLQRGGVGYSCENMVYAIYHEKCYISESYGIGPGTLNAKDEHTRGSIIVADDGHIIFAYEQLTGVIPDFAHNSAIEIKRSDYPEDETSWINAIAKIGGYYDLVGDPAWINPRFSYPSLDKLSNGHLFMLNRYSTIGDLDNMSVHRSEDHGVSWNAMAGPLDGGWEIVDLGLELNSDLLYKGLCSHPDDGIIYVTFFYYDTVNTSYPEIYFLLSSDEGITWESIDGVLSVDITLGIAITKIQLDAGNGRVDNVPAVAGSLIFCRSGVITEDGIPYLAVLRKLDVPSPIVLYVYYWSGVAWIAVNTGLPISTTSTYGVTILERNDAIELIAFTEENSIWKWRVYRSLKTDLINWTLLDEIGTDIRPYIETEGGGVWHTFNYVDIDYETDAHVFDTQGLLTFSDYYDFYVRAETNCSCCSGLAKPLTIEYENTHDFAGILSEYKGRVHLCADIRKPDHKIIKSGIERDGEIWIQKIITQKIYRFNILCTESLIDTLTMIPSYETITVHFGNESAEVKEFSVAPPEWKYEGLGQLEISFIIETIIKTNCDEDYELQEELILNGDFSAWVGDDPVNWTVIGEAGVDPEISEVAPHEGHGGVGTGACNIYSTGVDIWLQPTIPILTIGKTYLVEIEVTKLTNGIILFRTGNTDPYTRITSEGIHRFIKICAGDTVFTFRSLNICDVTIDNVSVKLYS